ncbi:MAG: hypothetical protein IPI01_16830 [Ignavibacteriae bacterium]|nr:hypothetical protein [Ignavibacteriota bacterium]
MPAFLRSALLIPLVSLHVALCSSPSVTVPFTLDHNRMLIQAEFLTPSGSWLPVRLWVDSGNPELLLASRCAADIGTPIPADSNSIPVATPAGLRIGGMTLNLSGVSARAMNEPRWLFSTMHIDANLPSTVLARYDVVFDYPARTLTIAAPGSLPLRGTPLPIAVHPRTGIAQVDVRVGPDSLSFALDNGASYSFTSVGVLTRLMKNFPGAPLMTGAYGCANIWGWWPDEASWKVIRIPHIRCSVAPADAASIGTGTALEFTEIGIVGVPDFYAGGVSLGTRYSRKTARPVVGFLGPNAFLNYRVHIAFSRGLVTFERGATTSLPDMDIAGLTLQPSPDGGWDILGVAQHNGTSIADGIEAGDRLMEIDGFAVTGATMGTVADKLRGTPGERRVLMIERNGVRSTVVATVQRLM